MKLYSHPISQHSRRVHMLLEELAMPFELRPVALPEGEHKSEWFRALNPNGQIPVIDDDGHVLFESHAIMRYLADKQDARTWYPSEPKARAEVDKWLDWNHTRLNPPIQTIAINVLLRGDDADAGAVDGARAALANILPVLDGRLGQGGYVAGNDPTIADLSIASTVALFEMARGNIGDYPAVARWYGRMKARPSFEKSAPPVG